jgi:hypothetical protein
VLVENGAAVLDLRASDALINVVARKLAP